MNEMGISQADYTLVLEIIFWRDLTHIEGR
jgi:hypothetical protein